MGEVRTIPPDMENTQLDLENILYEHGTDYIMCIHNQ